ncbi:MAG: metal-dependent hydrolase [Desulfobacterales bacterium]|nr:metal-dependent hydrolase [Desulfobacterales bacterium]
MPTAITHAVVAGIAGKTIVNGKMPLRFWFAAVLCSVIPDADVIGFYFGVKYGEFLGHRGFFHSIFFALIFANLVMLLFVGKFKPFSARWWKYTLFFFIVGASHGILDAFTNGGLGIALLSPFDDARYFFPWTPISVSPIGLKAFLSEWGLRVMICEIKYIWLPMAVVFVVARICGRLVRLSLQKRT